MTAERGSPSWRERMEYWAERIGGGGSSPVLEGLVSDLIAVTQLIQTQTDGLEITADQISLNADQINLNTDTVEATLAAIDATLTEMAVRPEVQLTEGFLAMTGAELALAAPNTRSQGLILRAVKSDGTANSATVKLGSLSGALLFRLPPAEEKSIDPPSNGYIDLSQILVEGNVGDGIAYWSMSFGTPNA